jgi:trimethylamine---corrinoid protein Co-methyltransferase
MKRESGPVVGEEAKMPGKSNLVFQVLDDARRAEIHSAALEVLERVGVEIRNEAALEVARTAGAFVEGTRVRFPPALVEKCIRSAPSRVVLSDRHGRRTMMLEGDRFYFGPGPTATYTIDPLTGDRKIPSLADTQQASRVIDALPNIDFQMDFGSIGDVDARIMDVCAF